MTLSFVCTEKSIINFSGISWAPQYDLNILSEDCQHEFQAFAEITNGTKQEYRIHRTELFGGDVYLQKETSVKRRRDRERSRSRSRSLSSNSNTDEEEADYCDLAPTIDAMGEVAGKVCFFRYCILYFEICYIFYRDLFLFN